MGDIVNLRAHARPRRSIRGDVPEGGAMVLLFTGIQYVRDDACPPSDAAAAHTAAETCARDKMLRSGKRSGSKSIRGH